MPARDRCAVEIGIAPQQPLASVTQDESLDYLVHVDAISVSCPTDIMDTPGRVPVFASKRPDRKDWNLQPAR